MEEIKRSYEEDLTIDRYALDDEWVKQPTVFMEWSEHYAQAILERDRAKEKLDLIRAEIDADVRTNPEKYDLQKITESAISSAIIQTKEYGDAMNIYIEAVKFVNILGGAKDALNHKKAALENLTRLYLENYYAKPNIPKEVKVISDDNVRKKEQLKLNLSMKERRIKDE
jgi:hypothetical protein